jgi:predicted nucleic acid-binding protein
LILVDTSIWVDHFRSNDARLTRFLDNSEVSTHPFVVGEIAVGNLRNRDEILLLLEALPMVVMASHEEALMFVANFSLAGRGLGYIDVHLLASVSLTPQTALWSKDKRLLAVAQDLSLRTVAPS